MALIISGQICALREVKLANKPAQMIAASAKATVPVLVLNSAQNGHNVLDESLSIMRWALQQNDPEGWLNKAGHKDLPESASDSSGGSPPETPEQLIAANDGPFKRDLDRYKYHTRYAHENHGAGIDPLAHRAAGLAFLQRLEAQLACHNLPPERSQLYGAQRSLADIAIFPFIRQFANHDRHWFNALTLPHLHKWLDGHLTSDLFKTAMQKTAPWQEGDAVIIFPKAA